MAVGINLRLHETVERELEWDPEVDADNIGVTASDGVVTLTGYVKSFAEKLAAERAAMRISGVRGVANDLDVRLRDDRLDVDIARDALYALQIHLSVPRGVKVAVRDGQVALEGSVEWMYQKQAAEAAVRHLRGVRSVSNMLVVMPRVSPVQVRDQIEEALLRSAEIDARGIRVSASDGHVTLSGTVRSLAERQEAGRAAWAAPGVTNVDNRVTVTVN